MALAMADVMFSSRSRRIAQLEDELAGQQLQLDTMRKALANVVDVATHRLHKEQIAAKLANKADLDLLEKHHADVIEVQNAQLSEAMAKKADAVSFAQCQRDLSSFAQDSLSAMERHVVQLARAQADNSAQADDIRLRHDTLLNGSRVELGALEVNQKALAASLAEKADRHAVAEQEQRLSKTEKLAQLLEINLAEVTREHLSARISAEMSSEVLQQADAAAMERQMQALDATKAELASLERLVGEMQDQQLELNDQAIAKQDEWYKEKDHEQYLLAVARKDRQDNQLIEALAKKADVSWYEQQKAIIDATQVSLTILNGTQQELRAKLMDKVDTHTFVELQRRLQLEISQAKQDTDDVSKKLDRHREHLDMARGQLLETIRQQGDMEVSLSASADKGILEHQEDKLETLFVKVTALEHRQDAFQREAGHLQEQLFSASRRASAHSPHSMINHAGPGLPHAATTEALKAILHPPASPIEKHHTPRRVKGSPYLANAGVAVSRQACVKRA